MLRKKMLFPLVLMGLMSAPVMASTVPVNNTIDGARWLDGNGNLLVNNEFATDSGVVTNDGSVENDLWFTFRGDGRNVRLETRQNGTDFDTQIWAFTGYDGTNLSSLTQVGYDDDGGSGVNARLAFATIPGVRYWFIVDGYSGATGNAQLRYRRLGEVPVPAAGLLLGGVLLVGGWAAAARRKRAQA